MNKKKTIKLVFSLVIFTMLFAGCTASGDKLESDGSDIPNNITEDVASLSISFENISIFDAETKEDVVLDISKINNDLTFGEALNLLGAPCPNEINSVILLYILGLSMMTNCCI